MKDHYCFFPPKRVIKVSLTSERNTIITLHSSVILFYFIQSHLNFVFLKEKERASLKGHGDGAGIAEGLWPSGGSGCVGLCGAVRGCAGQRCPRGGSGQESGSRRYSASPPAFLLRARRKEQQKMEKLYSVLFIYLK